MLRAIAALSLAAGGGAARPPMGLSGLSPGSSPELADADLERRAFGSLGLGAGLGVAKPKVIW